MRFYLHTLGCPKNEVDSEGMARILVQAGHNPIDRPAKADILIVNTCGFIDIAIEESTDALKELAARKRPGQFLIAAGCLAQRYAERLRKDVPQIDAVVGTREIDRIGEVVGELPDETGETGEWRNGERAFAPNFSRRTPSAYLKIADGCSAACAFCIIPQIKGPYSSKPADQVVEEARQLASAGAKEIVFIAQDTTAYGLDRGERDALADLIPAVLSATPEIAWLRLMYAYPTHITDRLIEVMASHSQVCHYLDIPLQHAHPAVLKRMRRPSDIDATRNMIRRLREAMPDIALRTSLIAGFPGETETEFRTLLDFMEEVAFDRLGVFVYSREDDTLAATLPNQVPNEVKQRRFERAMELQQRISLQRNRAQVGRELDVLVEGVAELVGKSKHGGSDPNAFRIVGRTYRDAPEVDGLIFCQGQAEPGEMVRVKVIDALEYDLLARIVQNSGDRPEKARTERAFRESPKQTRHGERKPALLETRG